MGFLALMAVVAIVLATLVPGTYRVAGRDNGKIVVEAQDGTRSHLTESEYFALVDRDKSPEQRIEELSDACSELAGLIEASDDLPDDSVGAAVAPIVEALIGLRILGGDDEKPPRGRTAATEAK